MPKSSSVRVPPATAAHSNPRGRGGMVDELGEDRRSAAAALDGCALAGRTPAGWPLAQPRSGRRGAAASSQVNLLLCRYGICFSPDSFVRWPAGNCRPVPTLFALPLPWVPSQIRAEIETSTFHPWMPSNTSTAQSISSRNLGINNKLYSIRGKEKQIPSKFRAIPSFFLSTDRAE